MNTQRTTGSPKWNQIFEVNIDEQTWKNTYSICALEQSKTTTSYGYNIEYYIEYWEQSHISLRLKSQTHPDVLYVTLLIKQLNTYSQNVYHQHKFGLIYQNLDTK